MILSEVLINISDDKVSAGVIRSDDIVFRVTSKSFGHLNSVRDTYQSVNRDDRDKGISFTDCSTVHYVLLIDYIIGHILVD